MELLSGLILPAIMVTAIYVAVTILVYAQKRLPWGKKRRSPFTSMFLRSPGWSTFERIEDIRGDLFGYLAGIASVPAIIVAIPFMQAAISGIELSIRAVTFASVLAFVAFLILLVKLYRCSRALQQYRLGYEGEVAVAQELGLLMKHGFNVFHDLPTDKFNIDHVVVGRTGVFAVETKARRKSDSGHGKKDYEAEYTGNKLIFPHATETKAIEQARRQAIWLSNWLSSAVGESVVVTPVLAIPGWFINRTGRSDVYVYNGKSPDKIFPKIPGKSLPDSMIRRISHQLEAKCRDVEPRG